MCYDQARINELMKKYCETGSDLVFEQLIQECEPLIRVIVSRYSDLVDYAEDACQDIKLMMWSRLRKPSLLKKGLRNPTVFLFSRIWPAVVFLLKKYGKSFGTRLSVDERRVLRQVTEYGRSLEEAAEVMGIDLVEAESLYSSAKMKLLERVAETDFVEKLICFDDLIDPAKLYEVKEIIRRAEDDLVALFLSRRGIKNVDKKLRTRALNRLRNKIRGLLEVLEDEK